MIEKGISEGQRAQLDRATAVTKAQIIRASKLLRSELHDDIKENPAMLAANLHALLTINAAHYLAVDLT